MALTFAVSFAPNHPKEVAEWCRVAEDCGFERVGLVDSQAIYRELYVSCTAGLQASKTVKLGPRVTNALTRHPSVTAAGLLTMAELAPGRIFAGVGTGDSALINIGLRPVKLGPFGEFVKCLRGLMRGERVSYQGSELQLTWSGMEIPIYVAAHGPKTLELAGQCADGVIYGDGVGTEVVKDALAAIASGAAAAGRSLEDLDIWWGLCGNVADTKQEALSRIKMLLAAKANQLARFSEQNKHVPSEFREVLNRIHKGYSYREHQKPGESTTNARLVSESGLEGYLADRYAIVGTPEECLARLHELEEMGVRKIWLNVHFEDKVGFMKRWSREVMAKLK
ncbi:MAG: LLM class flavin-dependent oxidoreductase [Deltaproteobacteria bacterium]|nr:LLM class flavin-dependent oxidoreductase [Deltaproteobacteria bacterium]